MWRAGRGSSRPRFEDHVEGRFRGAAEIAQPAGGDGLAKARVAGPVRTSPIPLSTAENCVFALENCRVGVGNLIVISLLNPFWPCRPTAEIGHLFWPLAADRERNSTAFLGFAEFGISEMLIY
jgi:hypothetical protein